MGSGLSLPFGPFNQSGTYAFGIRIDERSTILHQVKAGFVDIQINGMTVQSEGFDVSPHVPAQATPVYYFTL